MHGGIRSKWEPRQVPGVPMLKDVDGNEVMTTAFIVDGNGGEYRKTFHGTGAGKRPSLHYALRALKSLLTTPWPCVW